MGKNKERIRYKYREVKEGFRLDKVKCPVCGSNHINWAKVVSHTSWDGKVGLIAECWSGNTSEEKPKHLFLIQLDNLPIVELDKVKIVKNKKIDSHKKLRERK